MRGLLFALLLCAVVRAEPLEDRVRALAQPYVDAKVVVGMTIGLRDGETRLIVGLGEGKPGGDAVYEIGSVSKTFTGVLLAGLVEEGKVRLDQPVGELLPKGVRVPPITLLDLATHSSGLPRMPTNFAPKDPRNPFADYTPARMYDYLGSVKLGPKRYAYSNLGMGLLGHALAVSRGKTYEALLVERICKPLKMDSTRIEFTEDMRKRLRPGHDVDGQVVKNWDIPTLAGAGGIRSDVRDMMRFLDAAMSERKEFVAARQPRRPPMALGWHISAAGLPWHNGQTGGYHSYVTCDKKTKRSVVVLADTATGEVDRLGTDLWKLLAGEPVAPRAFRGEAEVGPEVMKRYVGRYRVAPTFAIDITFENGHLFARATNQAKFRLYASSETRFYYKIVKAEVAFGTDDDGKVTRLTLYQNGRVMEFLRE